MLRGPDLADVAGEVGVNTQITAADARDDVVTVTASSSHVIPPYTFGLEPTGKGSRPITDVTGTSLRTPARNDFHHPFGLALQAEVHTIQLLYGMWLAGSVWLPTPVTVPVTTRVSVSGDCDVAFEDFLAVWAAPARSTAGFHLPR